MKTKLLLLFLLCCVTATSHARRIEQPDILFQQRKMFEVVAVERSDTATVLDMRVHQKPNLWFLIGSDILLRDPQGRFYPIQRLDSKYGKGLDEKIWSIGTTFPPIWRT